MYRTQYSIGTSLSSLHILLVLPVYPLLAMDWSTELSLFTHHMWIGGFFIVGAGAHAALFFVVDYEVGSLRGVERLLAHRHSLIAHLNWVCIFLGFHSFGMYIHNDTLSALGRRDDLFGDDAIPFRPVLGLLGQSATTNEGIATAAGTFVSTRLTGTADLLVHHIHAFTIHVTVLILAKGVLFARSSRLVSDKGMLGFRFPCDGPGRGGTCQVSAWDHTYLGLFWMYNCISVVIFHASWKLQSNVLGVTAGGSTSFVTGGSFAANSITINGWLRDFLWSEASQVI